MSDDITIRLDGEEYVLRKEGAGLKVGSRSGGPACRGPARTWRR